MRLVVDANFVIAAFMRDSTVRRLLLLGGHDLHAPAYLFEEIEAHFHELQPRSGLSPEALRDVLGVLRGHLHEHDPSEYADRLADAQAILAGGDSDDAPYVALALALKADGVWSEDRRFATRQGVRVYRTAELLKGR